MIVEIRTERKEITFIKSMDGGKEPYTTCFLSIYVTVQSHWKKSDLQM